MEPSKADETTCKKEPVPPQDAPPGKEEEHAKRLSLGDAALAGEPGAPDRVEAVIMTFPSLKSPAFSPRTPLVGVDAHHASSPSQSHESLHQLDGSGVFVSQLSGGKPLYLKRGPGRPRKDGRAIGSVPKKPASVKLKKINSGSLYARSTQCLRIAKKSDDVTSVDGNRLDAAQESPPRAMDDTAESDTSSVVSAQEKLPEEIVGFQEQWPGKFCGFCNLGERSPLGQGEVLRFDPSEDFDLSRIPKEDRPEVEREAPLEKTIKTPVTWRRQKSSGKNKRTSNQGVLDLSSDFGDELDVGFADEPDVSAVFDSTGHCYAHFNCAYWSHGVLREADAGLKYVHQVIVKAMSQKCSACYRYGASIPCHLGDCVQMYHFPCAANVGAFQWASLTPLLICPKHLDHVPAVAASDAKCTVCDAIGDLTALVFCTSCGRHYHGTCLDLDLTSPGIRAGWLCPACKACQICRQSEDGRTLITCDTCDKAFHLTCLRPVLTSTPKHSWKCKNCRVCSDCGSRTPGSGPSSRWHGNFTICDSCYQQRNKGLACPLCGKAYRHFTQREMVQCTLCKKYVHGTCDPAADLTAYRQRKETSPQYEYVCPTCRRIPQNLPLPVSKLMLLKERRDRIGRDEGLDCPLLAQDLVCSPGDESMAFMDLDTVEKLFREGDEMTIRTMGLGKGKPFSVGKLCKKKLGVGRPKGSGKMCGKIPYQRRSKMAAFVRKRGPKPKMRGLFGVPGVGLQRPDSDMSISKTDDEPGVENRLVLCSAKDEFVLQQDVCVMCGAFGNDQEGRLISCAHCGQCYHPYCVSVKVTKVILQKGWRCLDCTVCEGCGERHDEARLILCDDCDISYHIYCMDPPLDYVPQGNWKCKWCAMCHVCGTNDPGFNCTWQNSYTLCGPCSSLTTCPSCSESYMEGELIIQCVQCERWLHAACDAIKTELEAEKCADEGYNCMLCRPSDVLPPHLLPPQIPPKPPTPPKSPDVPRIKSQTHYFVDGVCLSEMGMYQIKALTLEQPKKKRRKLPASVDTDTEAGILATIESVVAGGSADNSMEIADTDKVTVDAVDFGSEQPKDGSLLPKLPEVPEGYTVITGENGEIIMKKKRQRNLQKLGIGGFIVRPRGTRVREKEEEPTGQDQSVAGDGTLPPIEHVEKPKRKPQRRKQKNKLIESFPSYLQEAFFGKDLLDTNREGELESGNESEDGLLSLALVGEDKTIKLSQEELKAMEAIKARHEHEKEAIVKKVEPVEVPVVQEEVKVVKKAEVADPLPKATPEEEEDEGDTDALKDILPLPGDLLDNELVDTIMNEGDDITKNEGLDEITGDSTIAEEAELTNTQGSQAGNEQVQKDELSDFLSSQFNLESMVDETCLPAMDSKEVEDIFKGVLTDESQESQDSSFSLTGTPAPNAPNMSLTQPVVPSPALPQAAAVQSNPGIARTAPPVAAQPNVQQGIASPMSFPPPSPYHSEYSNSPQFSPAFSEPPSPWPPQVEHEGETPSYNQRNILKWEADESLGANATISAVLYANLNCPDLKREYPTWSERVKQIAKIWRSLPPEKRAPYLQKARENRAASRIQKVQQDQEKLLHQKSPREAVEERQWKQLQAFRHQQAQQHQRVLQEHRIQGGGTIVQVQRQLTEDGAEMTQTEQVQHPVQLQVTAPQEHTSTPQLSPCPQPSPGTRPVFTPPIQVSRVCPPTLEVPAFSQGQEFHNTVDITAPRTPRPQDPYARMPFTPRPTTPQDHFPPQSPVPQLTQVAESQPGTLQTHEQFGPATSPTPRMMCTREMDPYAKMPATPHPDHFNPPTPHMHTPQAECHDDMDMYKNKAPVSTPVSSVSGDVLGMAVKVHMTIPAGQGPGPEMARQQLRDLLQRQQMKKIEQEHMLEGHPRQWEQEKPMQEGSDCLHPSMPPAPYGPGIPLSEGSLQAGAPGMNRFRQPFLPSTRHRLVPGIPQLDNVPRAMTDLRQPVPPDAAAAAIAAAKLLDARARHFLQRGVPPHLVRSAMAQLQREQHGNTMEIPRMPIHVSHPEPHEQTLHQSTPMSLPADAASPNMTMAHPAPTVQENPVLVQQLAHPILNDCRVTTSAPEAVPTMGVPVINPEARPCGQNGQPAPNTVPQLQGGVDKESREVTRSVAAHTQEIPESIAGEIEPEQPPDGGIEGEAAELADLTVDDDELLGMGNDFNILEYADPELDQAEGGKKTNILDENLDLEEDKDEENKDDKEWKKKRSQECRERKGDVANQFAGGMPFDEHLSHAQPPEQAERENPASSMNEADGHKKVTPHPMVSVDTAIRPQLPQVSMTQPIPQHNMVGAQAGMLRPALQNVPQSIPMMPQMLGAQHDGHLNQMQFQQLHGSGQPPPPYPGPPPPYPGRQQLQLPGFGLGPHPRLGPQPASLPTPLGTLGVGGLQGPPPRMAFPSQPRPLLTQEQPLLLEELLEQEKREQQKLQQRHRDVPNCPEEPLLSDLEYERLKADVLSTPNPPVNIVAPAVSGMVQTASTPQFPVPLLPAPPAPPENPITDQERQQQMQYEHWLHQQQQIINMHLRYYENEVNKLRKAKKSLNSKQRQLRKNGQELNEVDAMELERITREQSGFQKQLDQIRKQSRQHALLLQDYRSKQMKRQQLLGTTGVPPQQLILAMQSQAAPNNPSQSPMHSVPTPQSPLLSPSPSIGPVPSPMMQQSPMPSPLTPSPNPMAQQSPHPHGGSMQQVDDSPFSPGGIQDGVRPLASPQGGTPRMPSPQALTARLTSPQGMCRMPTQQGIIRQMAPFQEQVRAGVHVNMVQHFPRPPYAQELVMRPRPPMHGSPASTHQIYSPSQKPHPTNATSPMQRSMGSNVSSPLTPVGGLGSPPGMAMLGQSHLSPAASPMRRASGSGSIGSPLPERPQSVENPPTPRSGTCVESPLTPRSLSCPHTPSSCSNTPQHSHGDAFGGSTQAETPPCTEQNSFEGGNGGRGGGGGGGSGNSAVIPFMSFSFFGDFKLGLRGGSPMSVVTSGEGGSSQNVKSKEENASEEGQSTSDAPPTMELHNKCSSNSPAPENDLNVESRVNHKEAQVGGEMSTGNLANTDSEMSPQNSNVKIKEEIVSIKEEVCDKPTEEDVGTETIIHQGSPKNKPSPSVATVVPLESTVDCTSSSPMPTSVPCVVNCITETPTSLTLSTASSPLTTPSSGISTSFFHNRIISAMSKIPSTIQEVSLSMTPSTTIPPFPQPSLSEVPPSSIHHSNIGIHGGVKLTQTQAPIPRLPTYPERMPRHTLPSSAARLATTQVVSTSTMPRLQTLSGSMGLTTSSMVADALSTANLPFPVSTITLPIISCAAVTVTALAASRDVKSSSETGATSVLLKPQTAITALPQQTRADMQRMNITMAKSREGVEPSVAELTRMASTSLSTTWSIPPTCSISVTPLPHSGSDGLKGKVANVTSTVVKTIPLPTTAVVYSAKPVSITSGSSAPCTLVSSSVVASSSFASKMSLVTSSKVVPKMSSEGADMERREQGSEAEVRPAKRVKPSESEKADVPMTTSGSWVGWGVPTPTSMEEKLVVVKTEPVESEPTCCSGENQHFQGQKGELVVKKEVDTEAMDMDDTSKPPILTTPISCASQESLPSESQNVLLKQLLQNTACATTSQTVTDAFSLTTSLSQMPPQQTAAQPCVRPREPVVRVSQPFISQAAPMPVTSPSPTTTAATLVTMKVEKKVEEVIARAKVEPTKAPETIAEAGKMPTFPEEVKMEPTQHVLLTREMKVVEPEEKKLPHPIEREEITESVDKIVLEQTATVDSKKSDDDIKKAKRRQYQQKRRQSLGKDTGGPKKRVRKGSKLEEDYDTYIENMLNQLRQLPPLSILEPDLGRSFGMCPVFGCGDLGKISLRDYTTRQGDLQGSYGSAMLPHISSYYDTQPFGDMAPQPTVRPAPQQMGFYNQEFASPKFDLHGEKGGAEQSSRSTPDSCHGLVQRDDTPDTIVSSSSPECVWPEPCIRFPGLKLIHDDDDSEEEERMARRMSPVIPLIAPIPIRPRPGYNPKDQDELDKENKGAKKESLRARYGLPSPAPLREAGNVTVTLTLTSAAAEDVDGVLHRLATLLHIPPPTGFQVVERTTTPPSQKLGLYRTKGKDGKEGAPVDIQSILNGAAKFCRHCDVVILNNVIRKKTSELPHQSREDVENGEELYFCSTACYMQFALIHRSTVAEEKVGTVVDHPGDSSRLKAKDGDEEDDKGRLDGARKEREGERDDDRKELDDMDTNQGSREASASGSPPKAEERGPDRKPRRNLLSGDIHTPQLKKWKDVIYKYWTSNVQPVQKVKKPTDKEMTELLFRMGITVTPPKMPDDTRKCMFCHQIGDGVTDGPARLLNYDVDKWVHLNCALWSEEVYETVNGALMNVDVALKHSLILTCIHCRQTGATVKCYKTRCTNIYHLGCAVKDGCVFYKDKSVYCHSHVQKGEKDNELTTLAVYRRVYINRDENRQVAAVMHHADQNHLLRVGSLIFLSVGQLLPHQLPAFHTSQYIYPIGYKIARFYWSMRRLNKRCQYICSIHDVDSKPEFRILVQEANHDDLVLRGVTANEVWHRVLNPIAKLRQESDTIKLFPQYITGEDLFGLTEPSIVRVLESLPGIESLSDYHFKYGRNPLLELPLAINPTGCARAEPKLRTHFKRPHTQRTGSSSRSAFTPSAISGEPTCPYSKQFVHSKSSQYKKMKQEWRNNVYLARSKIQGLGLYAARDIEKHTMVIEYIGEAIRTELAEMREKRYESQNRGIYMFRLDENRVIDATLSGGLARYINHSCNPNCVAEIVEVERDLRIIIFANRRISRGEELAYDYKFDIEDDQHKIPCLCGAPNCRKWMN